MEGLDQWALHGDLVHEHPYDTCQHRPVLGGNKLYGNPTNRKNVTEIELECALSIC